MSNYEAYMIKLVKENIKRNLANHTVKQRHRDGDTVRLWRCDNNGSSVYHFNVCAPPGWLIVYGDIGECMWSREQDMIAFARRNINDLHYFSSKASRACIIKDYASELADEWLEDFKQNYQESYGVPLSSEQLEELDELRYATDSRQEFLQALQDSTFCIDEYPQLRCYTFQYIWKIEAIKWFLNKLDSGLVVKEQKENE